MTIHRDLHYFGKLRRKRDFIKSSGLSTEFYDLWNPWINTCTRKNSFLPFLASKSTNENSVWLFTTITEDCTRVGLTIMSNDMAQREYPFSLFYEFLNFQLFQQSDLKNTLLFFSERVEKFKKVVSIGEINSDNLAVFNSYADNNSLNQNIEDVIDNYVLFFDHSIHSIDNISTQSFWINLNNGAHITHEGSFTCTLYNKIYG